MLIGARNGMLVKGGYTARDYVQDGLVAMWDGIENTGWGVHDPAATVWKDCIQGLELVPTDGAVFQITDNAVVASRGSTGGRLLVDYDVFDSELTLEAYAAPSYNNTYYAPTFGAGRLGIVWANGQGYIATCLYASKQYNLQLSPTATSGCMSFSVASNGNPSSLATYYNGQLKPTRQVWNGAADERHNVRITLNERLTPFRYFRIYNRILTASEIAVNYAIDKARFNLP